MASRGRAARTLLRSCSIASSSRVTIPPPIRLGAATFATQTIGEADSTPKLKTAVRSAPSGDKPGSTSLESAPVKPRKGRKPKAAAPDRVREGDTGGEVAPEKIAKPKGRPRKVKVPDDAEEISEETLVKVKRRSGKAKESATERTDVAKKVKMFYRRKPNKDDIVFVADPTTPFGHLPNPVDWSACFERGKGWLKNHHFFLSNEDTIEAVAKEMQLAQRSQAANAKLTILEGYTGPGTMTRRFLKDDNVEKVVAMEDHDSFFPWLEVR